MSIASTLVSDLEEEAKNTRKMLALVPEAKLAWKPHEKSMTLGQLASHLAEAPSWTGAFLEPSMDFAGMEGYQPFLAKTRAECVAEFEKNHRACVEALRSRDDRFMGETWTMRKGAQVLMSQPRKDALRATLVHHAIHHRGQLSVYLRLLGVPLPPVYGPTADDPSFG
jgi:uncharacterized damage-inducible protein DinB